MFKLTGSFLGVLLFVASLPAMAGNYLGASYGEADVDISGYDTSNSYKIFGGSRFGIFGVEGAYIDMGDFDLTGSPAYVSVDGFEISGLAYHDVGSVTLFAKAGIFIWDAQASTTGLTIASDNGTDFTYGVGALYKFAAIPFSVRAEYQIFQDVSGTDIDMWSIGAQFRF
jgi:hypothetical protein